MSPLVQVFGRRTVETIHALRRPASEKRKARNIAQRFSGVLGMLSSLEVKVLYPT
jgi:hypothetical protein